MDPCLEGGYVIILDQQIPFLVRFLDSEGSSDEKHTIEMIRVRVMILVLNNRKHRVKLECLVK